MTASERFSRLMQGKSYDRAPVIEWAPWWGLTVDRWNSEGLELKVTDGESVLRLQRFFGLDGCVQTGYSFRSAATPRPQRHGAGIIKDRADYLSIKNTLYAPPERQYEKSHYDFLNKTRGDGDTVHFFTVDGFFWFARELFGIEPHMYAFYDAPELLHEMCSDYAEWLESALESIESGFHFDFMSFAEDMSYNNGPMFGQDTFEEFLAPYYKRVIPILKKHKIPVFIDSDGDITKAVDWYVSVGADGMFPLERQAGVDVSLYVEKHPQTAFLGHFDKMCMKFGEAAMRKEFERILPSCQKGKVIPSVDHQTPPDVSMENYKIYARLFREYAPRLKLLKQEVK
jgi:hypothetical protein